MSKHKFVPDADGLEDRFLLSAVAAPAPAPAAVSTDVPCDPDGDDDTDPEPDPGDLPIDDSPILLPPVPPSGPVGPG